MSRFSTPAATLVLGLIATAAQAAAVNPVSYDMPNGDVGTYAYWDTTYTGSGSTTTSHAALTGGLGDLTDGIIATQNWFNTENGSGTGPYVGWVYTNPTLTFHFGAPVSIDTITLYADDADGAGGVNAPLGIVVGSSTYSFADPVGSAPNIFAVSGLGFTGSDLSFTILNRSQWVFVSEVKFSNITVASAVPEPASMALALAGLSTLGAICRRRRAA